MSAGSEKLMLAKTWIGLIAMFMGLSSCPLAYGQSHTVRQVSDPLGIIDQESVVGGGTVFESLFVATIADGFAFAYWRVDGLRIADEQGRAPHSFTLVITNDVAAVAVFKREDEDIDGDGLPDWKELRQVGDLSPSPDQDLDGDVFTLKEESQRGDEWLIHDTIREGGISWRDSAVIAFAAPGVVSYTLRSEPTGFISSNGFGSPGSQVQVDPPPESPDGFSFVGWYLNGVRQVDSQGLADFSFTFALGATNDVVARYIRQTDDTDADGLADWREWRQFGDLSSEPGDDPDGDGFTLEMENQRGDEWLIADTIWEGGISWRDSAVITFVPPSNIRYTIKSDPPGIVYIEGVGEAGQALVTPVFHAVSNNLGFVEWTLNGVRQAVASGRAATSVETTFGSGDVELVAHFIDADLDSDGDGLPDWKERYFLGNLDSGPDDDPDGDGFSLLEEDRRGDHWLAADTIREGGVSWRDSEVILVNLSGVSDVVTSNGLPIVSIGDASVVEQQTSVNGVVRFSVGLSTLSTNVVSVDYSTADETAVDGSDYVAQSGTLIFQPGETLKTVEVGITGDCDIESNETFRVNLMNVSGAVLGAASGTGTIINDDALPEIVIDPVAQSATFGQVITMATIATNATDYQWFKDGVALGDSGRIEGAMSAELSINPVQSFFDGGDFQLVAVNCSGSVTSSVARLTITEPPIITEQPRGTRAVSLGDLVAFSVEAVGTPPLHYQWRFNSQVINNATNAALGLADFRFEDVGDYDVVVGNAFGSVTSRVARLSMTTHLLTHTDGVGSITVTPQKSNYEVGEQVALAARPGPFHAFSHWKDGVTATNRNIVLAGTNEFTAVFTNTSPLEFELVTLWENSYGGSEDEALSSVTPDGSGGYLLAGISKSPVSGNKSAPNHGDWDLWVVRVDSQGQVLWNRSYGGAEAEGRPNIMRGIDDGFVLAGLSNSDPGGTKTTPNHGLSDFWVQKLSDTGEVVWEKSFGSGGNSTDELFTAIAGSTGYLLGGSFRSAFIDRSGNIVWTNNLPFGDYAFDVRKRFVRPGFSAGQLFVFSESGTQLGDLNITDTVGPIDTIAPMSDGGLVVGGTSRHPLTRLQDIEVFRVNREGEEFWRKTLNGSSNDVVNKIIATPDGGSLIGGFSGSVVGGDKTSPLYGTNDMWLVRLKHDGSILWQASYGGVAGSESQIDDMVLNPDGTILVAGTSDSPPGGNKTAPHFGKRDYWVLKLLPRQVPVSAPLIETERVYPVSGVLLTELGDEVSMRSSQAGMRITYTTDGSNPDQRINRQAANYRTPISLTNTVLLRSFGLDTLSGIGVEGESAWVVPIDVRGGGQVILNGVNFGDDGAQLLRLEAKASNDWNFAHWAGDIAGVSNRILATVGGAAPLSLQAIFGARLDAGAAIPSQGAVHIDPNLEYHPHGSVVRLTAIPTDDHRFFVWGGNPSIPFEDEEDTPLQVRIGDLAPVVRANFAAIGPNEVTITAMAEGPGRLILNPKLTAVPQGTLISINAEPDVGGKFDRFLGDVTGSQSMVSFMATSNMVITGRFTEFVGEPPTIQLGLTNRVVFHGDRVELSVGVTGTAPLAYRWRRDGALIDEATNAALSLNSAAAADEGLYRVEVSNPSGSVVSEAAFLRVIERDIPWRGFGGVDGPVNALAIRGTKLYVGGAFENFVRFAGHAAWVDTRGLLDTGWPQILGAVTAAIPDAQGGWYVAWANGKSHNIDHLRSDRMIDNGFSAWCSPRVYTMAVVGDRLLVGGDFSHVNGEARSGFAVLDAGTGALQDWDPLYSEKTDNSVRAIAISADERWAFIGGHFDSLHGSDLVKLSLTGDGASLHADIPDDDTINALALHGDHLYVGGDFKLIGGIDQVAIGALRAADLRPDDGWNINVFQGIRTVYALEVVGNVLYVGGGFVRVAEGNPSPRDEDRRSNLAAIDLENWKVCPWNPGTDGVVRDLSSDGQLVYVAGQFNECGGLTRVNAAAVSAHPSNAETGDWDAALGRRDKGGIPSQVECINASAGMVMMGGSFQYSGLVPRRNFVEVDLATREATDWRPDPDRAVYVIRIDGDSFFLGGQFGEVDGAERAGIAAFNLDGAEYSLSDFSVDGLDSARAIEVAGNRIFVGARGAVFVFHPSGTLIRRISLRSWSQGFAEGDAYALAIANNHLYIGGAFDEVDGYPSRNLAALSLDNYRPGRIVPEPDGAVQALVADEDTVYVAGLFQHLGEQARNHVGAFGFDGRVKTWAPEVGSSDAKAVVNALVFENDALVLGGEFGEAGRRIQQRVAVVDKETGDATTGLRGRVTGEIGDAVNALAVNGGTIVVGGDFSEVSHGTDKIPVANLAVLEPGGDLVDLSPSHSTMQTITAGGDLWLESRVFGEGPISYQWYRDGLPLAGQVYARFDLPGAQPDHSGDYSFTASNGRGVLSNFVARIEIAPAPTTPAAENERRLSPGDHLEIDPGVEQPFTVSWFRNGVALSNAPVLVIPDAKVKDSAAYSFRVSNLEGVKVDSGPIEVLIRDQELQFADDFAHRLVLPLAEGEVGGSNADASFESFEPAHGKRRGDRSVWFSWLAPGTAPVMFSTLGSSVDTQMAVYTNANNQVPALTSLRRVVENHLGGPYRSSEVQFRALAGVEYFIAVDAIRRKGGPVVLSWKQEEADDHIPVFVSVDENKTATEETSEVTFSVSVDAAGQPVRFQWYRLAQEIPNATNSTLTLPNPKRSDIGLYRVRAGIGERVVWAQAGALEFGPSSQVQSKDSFDDLYGDPLRVPSGLGSGGEALLPGLVVEPEAGASQSFWLDGTSYSDQGEQVVGGTGLGNSRWLTFTCMASGLLAIDTKGSTIDPVIAVYTGAVGSELADLQLESSDRDGAGDERNSLLRLNVVAGRTYFLAVDRETSESGTVTVNLNLGEPPVILRHPRTQIVPAGGTATFSVEYSSVPAPEIQWHFNDEPIPGATQPTYTIDQVSPQHLGNYHATLENGVDFAVSGKAELLLNELVFGGPLSVQPGEVEIRMSVPVGKSVLIEQSSNISGNWREVGTYQSPDGSLRITVPIQASQSGPARLFLRAQFTR